MLTKHRETSETRNSSYPKPASPIRLIILLSAGVFVLRLFLLDVMRVEGHSMTPTLLPGRVIFVNRVAYGLMIPLVNRYITRWHTPKPGDIVVLPSPTQRKILVKRCIAVEGDHITHVSGVLRVNQISINLSAESASRLSALSMIPPGQILVLGDNLQNSVDSRNFGLIPVDKIIGKVIGVASTLEAGRQLR